MNNFLEDTIAAHKAGQVLGVPSLCTAHPLVLQAGVAQALQTGTGLLVAPTARVFRASRWSWEATTLAPTRGATVAPTRRWSVPPTWSGPTSRPASRRSTSTAACRAQVIPHP